MLEAKPVGVAPLRGGRVSLTRCEPRHAAYMRHCYQNGDFMDLYRLSQNRNESEAQIAVRLAEENKSLPQQRRSIEWVITRNGAPDVAEERPIGLGAIVDHIHAHRRAEFMVGIEDPADLQAGIALESTLLILDYAFNILKLNKLISYVYAYNENSEGNTEALGFAREGFLRQHIHHREKGFIDLYLNGLLLDDFRSNQRLARLSQRLLHYDITTPAPEVRVLAGEEAAEAERSFHSFIASRLAGSTDRTAG
jgi:RimJ/RimL family protein N-acetyltransferase